MLDPLVSPELTLYPNALIATSYPMRRFGLGAPVGFWSHHRSIVIHINVGPPDSEGSPTPTKDIVQASNQQFEAPAIPLLLAVR
jgi:hypothetical protein